MDRKQFHKTSNNCEINFNTQSRSYFSFFTIEFLLLLLLAVCIYFVYTSSIKGPFVFDDAINIQDNSQIRLTELTLDGIVRAGFESPCPHRPVANISFALNYYFNRYDVAGYHLVNILMHIATGIILFYFIKVTLGLLNAHNLKLQFEKNAPPDKGNCSIHNSINSSISTPQRSLGPTSNEILFIAFFTTCIWLVHPAQTQTVSYIVQRMNCMAAMFYILSLLLYAKARLARFKGNKWALFIGCILSGILSLGSKEIAATLPFFIILYEWYFFQEVSLKWLKRNSIYLLCFLFIIIFMVLFYLGSHPTERILSAYSHRDFNLWQRVLTEFRVVIYYISLLIFPHPMRLNLLHDFTISHSFINPTTTLLSFIAIAGMMVMAIWLAKRERLLSFCVLWFLGNLVIESSVIGLEIIFEHRVYLPSMFFILMLVILVYRFTNSKWIWGALLCAVAIIFSVWTYQRNMVWSDDVSLWEDCVIKSPHKPRQHYNLGVVLARKGNLDDAIEHYLTALKIKPDYLEAYYNLGNALARKGDAKAAIYNYRKALQLNPDFFKSYYNIARILYNQGKTGGAIHNYKKALIINNEMTQTLYNLSWIYATSINRKYRNGKKAVKLAEKLCILTDYQQPLSLDALAAAYAETGKFDKAIVTAQRALELALQLGPEEHVLGLKKRLKLYQTGHPYRQSLKEKKES
jgi:tetratricopeptide (TPR) repeat protein